MKLSGAVRRLCLAAVLLFSAVQVRATVPPNVFELNDSFVGGGVLTLKYYDPFVISTPGSYLVTLVDANTVLKPFSFLGMALFKSGGSPIHDPLTAPGSFTFNVTVPTSFTVLAFGKPGGTLSTDFSSFGITVAPIPEPEIWALMLVGTGLVGFQLRRKSRVAQANRLTVQRMKR